MPMNLEQACAWADELLALFAPHCEHLQIAGSCRRGRPVCNDIDLVAIPKVTSHKDMLGYVVAEQDHLKAALVAWQRERPDKITWLSGEHGTGKIYRLAHPRCQVDFYTATRETLGTVLLCRTGSAEHNIWLAERAQKGGCHWNPQEGLKMGRNLVANSEAAIYTALGLPWIEPRDRELGLLRQRFR